jgi:hypothetical protein
MPVIKKVIFVSLIVAAFFCMAAHIVLTYCYFLRYMPRSPRPELHRIYALNEHGWIVYLTWGENLLMNCLLGVFFGAILVLMGLTIHTMVTLKPKRDGRS